MKHIGIELYYIKDGCRYMMGCNIDANPLITSENNEAWARYLRDKLSTLVTEEAMQSPEFQKIEADIAERIRHEKEWAAGAAERERKERHRKKLGRTQSLGFIPLGLTVDYSVEYGTYVDKAITWTPEDADDFLFQLRSLERMAVKCAARCVGNHRPDAAYAQAYEVCRKIPEWKSRKELQGYFNQYKPRLRKFLNVIFKGLTDSAIAWNHANKLKEANSLIASQAGEYSDWGMTSKKLLSLQSDAVIIGEPVIVERTPNKEEQYQIYWEKQRKEEEARRKAEEEAERKSLIPANKSLEKALFIDCRLNWECSFIGYAIDKQAKQVDALLAAGMSHDALVLFLQIVKYMCKHFVSDEHWTMYDDMYDPDYSCELIADSLNKAGKAGKLSAPDISYFHKAWSEIQAMEACQNYGIADYKFDM